VRAEKTICGADILDQPEFIGFRGSGLNRVARYVIVQGFRVISVSHNHVLRYPPAPLETNFRIGFAKATLKAPEPQQR
jgi:hypothetical protein